LKFTYLLVEFVELLVERLTEDFKLCDEHCRVAGKTLYTVVCYVDRLVVNLVYFILLHMLFNFNRECEVTAVVVSPGDYVLLLPVYSVLEVCVFVKSSLLKVLQETAVRKLREDTGDVLLREGESLYIFEGDEAEFSHLIVEDVIFSEMVFAEECVGELVLLGINWLAV
jgi:hypothetical protein